MTARITGSDSEVTKTDDRDVELLEQRVHELNSRPTPRCGDFVRFADGHIERISHDWGESVQTSEGGSYYLGHGYVSHSGSLNPSIPISELRPTDDLMDGSCWFFHHDHRTAHNGVYASVPFRVYDVAGVRERVRGLGREWWSDYIAGETVAPLRDLDAKTLAGVES